MQQPKTTHRNFLATTPGAVLGCLFCCLLWGSAFPCIKIGYELLGIHATDTASKLLFAGTRFTLAGAMVIAFISVRARKLVLPTRSDIRPIATLCLFQTVLQYTFFYIGLSHAAGVTSSIIEAAANFFAILFAALIFRSEHLTSRKILGCVIGMAGVVAINLGGGNGISPTFTFSPSGEGLVLLSTCAGALSTCFIARFSKNHNPALLSGWQFLCGGLTLAAMGLTMGGHLDIALAGPSAVALLAYMAFISAGAYTVWSLLLAVNPVSRISVFGFMNPVFGVLLSAVLLGEAALISPLLATVSLALVAIGIVIVNRVPQAYTDKNASS